MEESSQFVVIDSSVILAKLMPDEKLIEYFNEDFDAFLKGKINFVAPELLFYEVSNAIKSSYLSKRFNENMCMSLLDKFLRWDIGYVNVKEFKKIVVMSIEYKLSVYDATYLYLANKHKCRLLTLDKKLRKVWEESLSI